MSTYFITVDQAENNEIFANMETINKNCACGQSYALYPDYDSDGSINNDIFIVCDACHDNNPRQQYI